MSNQKIDTQNIENKTKQLAVEAKNITNSPSLTFYGSKLFVKCFAWFIFIALINTILASVYVYFYHLKPAQEEFNRVTSRFLEDSGKIMIETYEKEGSLKFTRFKEIGNIWLFDENLTLLFDGQKNNHNPSFAPGESPNIQSKPNAHLNYIDINPPPPPIEFSNNSWQNPPPPPIEFSNNPWRKPPPPKPNDDDNEIRFKNTQIKNIKNKSQDFFKLKKMYLAFYQENEPIIKNFAKFLLDKESIDFLKIKDEDFFGTKIISDKGKNYVAIIHVPKMGFERESEMFLKKAKNVLPFFVIICAILCLLMARNLAKPVVELQEASRRFANGDFSNKTIKSAMSRYDEIGDLAKDFTNMAERIESGINNQKRLFHDISHELRSPLARMQVAIELLQMKVGDSEKKLVERIEKDVTRMNALIEEVLQFSKLENRQIASANEDISLETALKNVCEDAEFEGNNNHKGIKLDIKQNITIKGNSVLIERAFENIIRNSLRFTPENTSVEVSLEKKDNKAIIKIEDYGPGIPEDKLGKVFDPFYCVSQDRNPQKGGIGLGLPIALKAIEFHNGKIIMSNKPEGGLLATIEIPIE